MTPEDYRMIKWVSSRHPNSPYTSENKKQIKLATNFEMFIGVSPWILLIFTWIYFTM